MKKTMFSEIFTQKRLKLGITGIMSFAFCNQLNAQTSSYDANTVPVGGSNNAAFGKFALNGSTTGSDNTAIGVLSMTNNTTGSSNTAIGRGAGGQNRTGYGNVACGFEANNSNQSGNYNVAVGQNALFYNIVGGNTAVGSSALKFNTTGTNNVATGFEALYNNTHGVSNTGMGHNTLYLNTSGSYNTASGTFSLSNNVSGNYNSAFGYQALLSNNAANNTSTGFRSLYSNSTGANNTAFGFATLYTNATGANNTGLGSSADVASGALSNATAIGAGTVVNASNKVRIGNATVTVVEGPVAYTFSDGRFKTNVKEEDVKGLEFIKKLRPVVYNLDTKKITEFWTKNMPDTIRVKYLDQDFTASSDIRQSGFIAQEVAAAAKSVNYDFNGVHVAANDDDNYSIAYGEMVVPLVKAVQEQQKLIESLQQQIDDLKKEQRSSNTFDQGFMSGSYLEQNVPNPFSRETVIEFNLTKQFNTAYMAIYDLSGKQLKTVPIKQHGISSVTISADQLAPGMYIYSIMVDGRLFDSKRMVVADN